MITGGVEEILSKKERYKLQYASKAERMSLYLSTMFSLDRIKTILSRYLPKIGINKCAIYELSDQNAGKPEYRFVYKYIDGIELEDNGEIFGNRLFPEKQRSVYNVHLLEVNLEIIGCVFFDYALKDDRIYLTLATQLASAINGTRTLEILKDSLNEKEMLMKELQHRVKNNLTTIISLLNIQSDKIQDESTSLVFSEACNKIRSMSLIYDQLYKPTSNLKDVKLDDYLLSLSEQLAEYYHLNTNRVTVNSELDPVSIDMKRCVYIGLLTNEIMTNAYKYAFPEKDGIISIRLIKNNDTITLEFTDNGIGIDDNYNPDNPHQYGLELVGINVRQLKGTLEIGNADGGGTRVAITFPG